MSADQRHKQDSNLKLFRVPAAIHIVVSIMSPPISEMTTSLAARMSNSFDLKI
jgi:hypothetical protein